MSCKQLFVNLGGSGGSVATGMLQIAGGVALDGTLRFVQDQASTNSPLKLSTTDAQFVNSTGLQAVKYIANNNDTGGYWLNHEVSLYYNGGRNILSPSSGGSLSVLSAGGAAEYLRIANSDGFSQFSGNLSIGLSYGGSPLGKLHILGASAANALYISNNAATAITSIDSNGILNLSFSFPVANIFTANLTNQTLAAIPLGLNLSNDTPSTWSGNAETSFQPAPSIKLSGTRWNSATSSGSSISMSWQIDCVRDTGSTSGGGLVFKSDNNPFLIMQGSSGLSVVNGNNISATGYTSRDLSSSASSIALFFSSSTRPVVSGVDWSIFKSTNTFNPTSGSVQWNGLLLSPIINQTSTASGVVRGVHINPTLTRAVDFRALSTNFTFAAPASSSYFFRGVDLNYTINNGATQTGTSIGMYLNATETALNGMTHKLMSLNTSVLGEVYKITNAGMVTQLGRLNFGGDTSSFASINNSSGELFVKLADNSEYAGFACGIGANPTFYVTTIATNPAIGFFNSTPINKITTAVADAAFVAGGGGGSTIKTDDTIGGYTMGQVVQALINYGLLT